MTNIIAKIRSGQGKPWSLVRGFARSVLSLHLPVGGPVRALSRGLYRVHVAVRELVAWGARFFWYEPLFRGQCERVGERFRMEQLPYIAGRGRIVIGTSVRLSGKSSIGFSGVLGVEPQLSIGDGTFIGHDCSLVMAESITIGKNCLLAGGVSVRDLDGHPVDAAARRAKGATPREGVRRVVIGNDVWIGAGATILKGVTVGDRSIVGAGAVVTRDVPADCVVAGNPARIVRRLEARDAA